MINLVIGRARKSLQLNGGYFVLHSNNDAVLAYCDTEREADLCIEILDTLSRRCEVEPERVVHLFSIDPRKCR
jgi:hypothetical protein